VKQYSHVFIPNSLNDDVYENFIEFAMNNFFCPYLILCIARIQNIMEANLIILLANSFIVIELSELSSNCESAAP